MSHPRKFESRLALELVEQETSFVHHAECSMAEPSAKRRSQRSHDCSRRFHRTP